ncbi:MAG: D-aminoacyl-tRNA deacylase [Candidatus Rifleibacteriota bacterium]
MKALVQRVLKASLTVGDKPVSKIGPGLVCYLGVGETDQEKDTVWLARKVAGLRIFEDDEGKMNLSAIQAKGEILVVSQFTLYGSVRKGSRPSFTKAKEPQTANEMYEQFCDELKKHGIYKVAKGVFAADMTIEQTNQGPVTIMIDTEEAKN